MESVIELLMREFGRELTIKKARGFLFNKHLEIFREFESDINIIVDVANYRMYDNQKQEEKEIRKMEIEQTSDSNLAIDDGLFSNDFSYTDDQIFDLIRKNANWRDIERDITIFREIQKGIYQQILANKYGVKFTTISMVLTKVQGAVNYWKGKLFEDFIEKRLKQSGLFEKIIKEAGKEEVDVLAYHKGGKKLTIYSLKNIKIDREPYWLVVDELRPELARAKQQKKDYKVKLILLIFNNLTKQIKQFKIDYNNPVNIDISK